MFSKILEISTLKFRFALLTAGSNFLKFICRCIHTKVLSLSILWLVRAKMGQETFFGNFGDLGQKKRHLRFPVQKYYLRVQFSVRNFFLELLFFFAFQLKKRDFLFFLVFLEKAFWAHANPLARRGLTCSMRKL